MIKKRFLLFSIAVILFLSPLLVKQAYGVQSSVELIRYYNSSIKDYWSTTSTQIPNPSSPPSGYIKNTSQGYILTQEPQSNFFFFNDCYWSDKKDHFNSNADGDPNGPDGNCKNYQPKILLGYVWGSDRPGAIWTKRCYKSSDEHYTETGSTPCVSGFVSENGLGWILDHPYAQPGPMTLQPITTSCQGLAPPKPANTLNWAPGATNVDPINNSPYHYYQVFRSLNGSSWGAPIYTSYDTSYAYVDSQNLTDNTKYYYVIRAVNYDFSSFSNVQTITTLKCNLPPAPTVDLKMEIGFSISDNPLPQNSGTNASLQWETTNSPTSCIASSNPANPAWSGSVGTQSINSSPLGTLVYPPKIQQFSIVCSNSGGSSPVDTITVTVNPPQVPPKIQTTGGDVHSNEEINIPTN